MSETLTRAARSAAALMVVGLLFGACDDRQQRIEETAAPGMDREGAAPASGPDVDIDTLLPPPQPATEPADTMQPGPPAPPDGP